MVLLMARPTRRSGSRNAQFRRRVPADVLQIARGKRIALALPPETADGEPVRLTVTLGSTLRFSLQTDDKHLYERRQTAVLQQLDETYATILRAATVGPQHLSPKRCEALAGLVYKAFADSLEDNPVSAGVWTHVLEENDFALNGQLPGWTIADTPEEQARIERRVTLDRRFGPLVDAILLRERVICDEDSRNRLLSSFGRALNDAAAKLKRNTEGDYRSDPTADRFPKWEGGNPQPTMQPSTLTFDDLLTRWKREAKRAASSIVSFNHHVADLKAHLTHNDVRRVTKSDVVGWKDKLLERGLSAKTINSSYLASISALYNLAKRDDLIEKSPTDDVRIPIKRNGIDPLEKTYTDAEVAAILTLANKESLSYLRWVPWLTALTGARVSEIVQLWAKHVEVEGDIHFISIAATDDGGTLKTGSSKRKVPLHPALIERGFLDFVKARKDGGPLFYGDDDAKPRHRRSETAAHASKGPANRVREWIRANGFTDPRKAPNHAFRYWFKFKCGELDISDSVADAIQGHSDGSVAKRYRGINLAKKAEAIRKIAIPRQDER